MKNDDKDSKARQGQKDEEIRALIEERRTTNKKYLESLKNISKQIEQCIRENKRTNRQENIQDMFNRVQRNQGYCKLQVGGKESVYSEDT